MSVGVPYGTTFSVNECMGAFVFRLTPFAHSNQCDLILFSRDFERTRAVTVSSCGALPLPMTLPFLLRCLGSAMLARGSVRPPRGGKLGCTWPECHTRNRDFKVPTAPKYCKVNLGNNPRRHSEVSSRDALLCCNTWQKVTAFFFKAIGTVWTFETFPGKVLSCMGGYIAH